MAVQCKQQTAMVLPVLPAGFPCSVGVIAGNSKAALFPREGGVVRNDCCITLLPPSFQKDIFEYHLVITYISCLMIVSI